MDYPPIALAAHFTGVWPDIWKQAADYTHINGIGEISWDDICYLPYSAAYEIITRDIDPQVLRNADLTARESIASMARTLAALAPWRLDKQVYRFDADFEKMLFEQAGETDLPSNVFLKLPHRCIYIETSTISIDNKQIAGVFAHIEHDPKSRDYELRVLPLMPDGVTTYDFPVRLSPASISDNLRVAIANKDEAENVVIINFLSQILQLILYICSSNNEVKPSAEQSAVMRRDATIKDKYREIQKWDVGMRIGAAIRRAQTEDAVAEGADDESENDDADGDSSSSHNSYKRPHSRRAHWHHYWTGKRDGERTLILKWIAPTFIHLDADGELPTVIHPVQ